jgi:hydrogenase expression/formation protein HypE
MNVAQESKRVLLSMGSGGQLMHDFIRTKIVRVLRNPTLNKLHDAAVLNYGKRLAFTTDAFVVSPLFFPGGDIGSLAVCGTVNDLVMMGAVPRHLSLSFIIEEGFEIALLERITASISRSAKQNKVEIVTGDIKVVEKGAADKIFITTSGIGTVVSARALSPEAITAGDAIILTGNIGQHGLAVLNKRNELDPGFNIKSDCAGLGGLLIPLVRRSAAIKCMRDPTRGGVATTLNEIAQAAGLGLMIRESLLPISPRVKVACELLGIDPLYVANEGIAVMVVAKAKAQGIVRQLKQSVLGKNARVVGEVSKDLKGKVILRTRSEGERLLDMLTGEALPRIC